MAMCTYLAFIHYILTHIRSVTILLVIVAQSKVKSERYSQCRNSEKKWVLGCVIPCPGTSGYFTQPWTPFRPSLRLCVRRKFCKKLTLFSLLKWWKKLNLETRSAPGTPMPVPPFLATSKLPSLINVNMYTDSYKLFILNQGHHSHLRLGFYHMCWALSSSPCSRGLLQDLGVMIGSWY